MNIVTRRHLHHAAKVYRGAAQELRTWVAVVENVRWRNLMEVRATFKDADGVDGYVIFNVRQNRYRLVTVIHYAKDKPKETSGHVYIRSFLTHAEYDHKRNWDPFRHDIHSLT